LSQDGELVERFKKEFLLLKGLEHPNIVRVFDFGFTDEGEPFFAMEHIQGQDWKNFLQPLDYSKFWPLLVQACSTLDFLHSKGIVHGDLKPSNILITSSAGGQPVAKFTDFGFAEYGEVGESAWWRGTLGYLAPEIIRGERHSHQADLYSLGVLIYETLFGKRPFDAEELGQLAKSHLEKGVLIPAEPSISEDLKNLILNLLEKDPIDRCFSAREVLNQVETISGQESEDRADTLAHSLIRSADFVGREEALSVLRKAPGRAAAGDGSVVLISGESGVGKTRLLEEFKAQAQLEGISVVVVSLPRPESSPALKRVSADLLEGILQPAVFIVEHLENANEPDLRLILEVIDRARRENIPVFASIADEGSRSEKDTRTCAIEKEIESGGKHGVIPIKLGNLSEAEVGKLLGSMFEWKEREVKLAGPVYEKTKGSPLLTKRLMQWLVSGKHVRRCNGRWAVEPEQIEAAPVPEELAEKMEERLGRLSRDELDLVFAASVLGPDFDAGALSDISEVDLAVLQERLKNILAERILEPSRASEEGDRFSFPNGFTRDLVYHKIDPDKRRHLHRRVGGYLEEKRPSEIEPRLDELADHFYRAKDERRALKYALSAARRAQAAGDTAQAVRQLQRVLELYHSSAVTPAETKGELYCDLAEQYETYGDYGKSLGYFQKALNLWKKKEKGNHRISHICRRMARIYEKTSEHTKALELLNYTLGQLNPRDSPQEYASTLIDLARGHRIRSEYPEALSYLETAISMLRQMPPSREMGHAFNCMAGVHWSLGDYPKALESLSECLALFRTLEDHGEMAECHTALGVLLRSEGRAAEALEHFQEARAGVKSLCDPYKLSAFENNLALVYIDLNRWNQALECLSRSIELKRAISDWRGLGLSYNNQGVAYLKKGLFAKSAECLNAALQSFQGIRDRSGVALVYYNLGGLHKCKEKWGNALRYLERSLKMGRQLGEEGRVAECLLLMGEIAASQQNLQRAAEYLNQATHLFSKSRDRLGEAEARLALGGMALSTGERQQAGEILKQVKPVAMSLGNRWLEARYKRVCARSLKDQGEQEAHLQALLEVCGIFKELGARYELGKTYLELGQLKWKMGRTKEARALVQEALRIFEKSQVEGKRKETETLANQIKEMGHAEKERVQTLYKLADLLNSVWDTDELLSKALKLVIDLLNAERGAIILYSEKEKTFELKVSEGLEQETSEDAINISRRVLTDVVESDAPLIVEDAANDQEFAGSRSVKMHNILSILCVPLKTANRLIGTVYLDHRSLPAVFSSEDVDFLRAFASLIATSIEKSELYVKANEEIFQLKGVLHDHHQYPHIIGNSARMQVIFNLVERIADSKTSVLIHGESGTGKELIAHLIHARSRRKDGPFIRVNCAALPETLLESELFGIEEKAATGVGFRKGKFELADGGAIFLDEIGDMSLSVQAKVLRVLQEKEFERVGGQKSIRVDIRVISATNMDLQKKVDEGTFRRDLYYRLNTIVIDIPPLRERKDDLPYLVQHYAKKFSQENNKPQLKLTKRTVTALQNYGWPGNVRELEHLVESATLLSKNGEFPRELLPGEARIDRQLINLDRYGKLPEVLDWVEKRKILQALERNGWNQVKAAEDLGLNEASLRRRMRKHKIKRTTRMSRHN
jgi:Nif-specific regulatory protein